MVNVKTEDEAQISQTKNVLLALSNLEDTNLLESFCGSVFTFDEPTSQPPDFSDKTVYLCGDLSKIDRLGIKLATANRLLVIEQLATNFGLGNHDPWQVIDLGQVPILVHDVGVYYRRFFTAEVNYVDRVQSEHVFQSLTESNKPGTAHRTGIYLTPVEKTGDEFHFRLLRCSTNLSGPTENFRATDIQIVDALNQEAANIFEGHAPLNHALAQIYRNTPASETQKQTKAKIKSHADKTKDMPVNGIMAFCTFYDQLDQLQPSAEDTFDFVYKRTSGLTRLHFRLKPPVAERPECALPREFSITLYPNSVFLMPLSTNRLYTHEIRPSQLDAEKIPTRLGYVVRCSSTESVYKGDNTFLKRPAALAKLEPPTTDGMDRLRSLYAEENRSDAFVDYGSEFLFSMNAGDYTKPDYRLADEFRKYQLPIKENFFDDLVNSVQFETMGKGRQGTVLVQPDESRGTPIVRTTSRYQVPAHCFRTIHDDLAQQIHQAASLPQKLNNALIETYTNAYRRMGLHSDQALDLQEGSSIAVFSCYENPDDPSSFRKLVIESKEPDTRCIEFPLEHNSVVVFSLNTNQRFKHKIVMANSNPRQENRWLGVTFRQSKTYLRFDEKTVCLEDGTPFTLANEDEQREFFSLRGQENRETNFNYPRITYTISESDLLPPTP